MKIGIVGSGQIGGLVGTLWSQAGHEVVFSSRHPQDLATLIAQAGAGARAGTPEEAVAFGDVVLLSIPFGAVPDLSRRMSGAFERKIVLDTSNPYPDRDGPMAEAVLRSGRGTGPYLRDWFPGVRIVRAFNTVWARTLGQEAHRPEPRVGIPLASDDVEAMQIAATLVTDAGFEAVVVGPLVVAAIDGEMSIKRYRQEGNRAWLAFENRDLPEFAVEDLADGVIWGVVRFTIHWHVAKRLIAR